MRVPDTTAAEALDQHAPGQRIAGGVGPAWRQVKLSVITLPAKADAFTMPSVNEPFIAWTIAGEADFQERENNGPWLTSRIKKRATRMPPSQYLIKLRLDAARRLLRETPKSVITIANEVGHSNPSHFTQLFRSEVGMTPTDYRREG